MPEIVEDDLALAAPLHFGQFPSGVGQFPFGGQILQYAVADSLSGRASQFFLDAPEFFFPSLAALEFDHRRINAREPTDGSRQVKALDYVFPSVAFHDQLHLLFTGPVAHSDSDRTRQHFLDLGPVRLTYARQQFPGVDFAQTNRHDSSAPDVVVSLGVIHRQSIEGIPGLLFPNTSLALDLVACRVLDQRLGPLLI